MARLRCQLLEILRLRSAVAFAKGMDVVHVTDYDAGLSCKLVGA